MIGTEKQIEWAETIKSRFLGKIKIPNVVNNYEQIKELTIKMKTMTCESDSDYVEWNKLNDEKDRLQREQMEYNGLKLITHVATFINSKNEAIWFIENRDNLCNLLKSYKETGECLAFNGNSKIEIEFGKYKKENKLGM